MKQKIVILLFTVFIYQLAYGQYYEESRYSGIGTPVFEYNINRQFSMDFKNSTVLIFCEILNDDLTFIKSDSSGFDAEVEWLIAVYKEETLIFSRVITRSLNVPDYAITNSRVKNLSLSSEISLEAGTYQLLMRTIDLNTKKSAQTRLNIDIPNYYEESVAVSDIMLLESVEIDSLGNMLSYKPILSNNFNVKEGEVYLFFNIYSRKTDVDAHITYSFTGRSGKVDFDSVLTKAITENISTSLLKIQKDIFKENSYTIKITAEIEKKEAFSQKKITFYWSNVPGSTSDIDEALNQMVYILPADSLSYYLNAQLSVKQDFFKRFWKERDPNPKTDKNELMDEYFSRINYANENYSSFGNKGWATDRGRILIKFGHPDDIERHPFELQTRPYVIWRYYSLRKLFVFEDYTGFGDYRLHPEYINEEFQ
jgi:GWxTD domain-containing protein